MIAKTVSATIPTAALGSALIGGAFLVHVERERSAAETGLRNEVHDNLLGVQQLRQALATEEVNVEETANQLQESADGKLAKRRPAHLSLAVLALTDANWRAATATGTARYLGFAVVARFAGAYFEQERLAQLQTSTLDCLMQLQSYVGHDESGHSIALTPEQSRLAAVQARLLLSHLRSMLRMTDGVQDAYRAALR